MATHNVGVNLLFQTKTGQLVSATQELNKLNTSSMSATSATSSLSSAFTRLAGVAGVALGIGALAAALKNQASAAIALNSSLENIKTQLAAMVYINTQNTTTTGKAVSAQEKYTLATKEANKQLEGLKSLATQAGYSVNDLAEAYKAYGQGAVKQMNFEQMQKSFEALTIAAQGAGTDIETLKFGLDNLATGTVIESSALGVFIKSLGMSNEMLKEAINQGTLYELIMEKTAPAVEAAAQSSLTYTKATSRLKSAWDSLLQESGAKFFDSVKESILSTAQMIESVKDSIVFAFNFLMEKVSTVWGAFKEVFEALGQGFGTLMNAIKGLFGEAAKQMSLFEVALRTCGSAAEIIAYGFKTLANAIKAIVLSIQGALNGLMSAYYTTKDFFGLADSEDAAKMKSLVDNRAKLAADLKAIGDKQVADTKNSWENLKQTWNGDGDEKGNATSFDLGLGDLTQSFNKASEASAKLTKDAKVQVDTLKSWWENEFNLRAKNIELMKEGKEKELLAEELRFDKVISNLNFEIQKKLESGEITEEQALRLYEVEEKLHKQKMKQIAEYNATYEKLKQNINSALEENIGNALNGKFKNFGDVFTDMFSSVQESITKGFATSLSQAFMDSQVMEAFNKTLSGAIDGLSGSGGATGGIFSSLGGEMGAGGGLAGSIGGALGGFALGAGAGGLVSSILGDSSNKKKASNYAMGGAAAGAAIGSIIPGIGTALGGLIGGIGGALVGSFKSTTTKILGQGVQLWQDATKSGSNMSEYVDKKTTTKKYWGMSSSSDYTTEYYSVDLQNVRAIANAMRGYGYLLEDIGGGVKDISVKAGRYSNYAHIANTGAKEMIAAFLQMPDVSAVYNIWASYAKSVNKEVGEALSESLQKYVDSGNSFEAWKLEFEGKSVEAAKFQADLAQKQVDRLLDSLGAENVTIDNFMAFREEMLKQSFDPQTIERINLLGEHLMNASEAAKKYEDALKDESKTKLNLIDPFLNKAQKLDEISKDNTDTSEKLLVSILSTLKQSLRVSQENQNELLNGNLTPALARV